MYRKILALACAAAVIFTSLASVELAQAQRPWRKNMYDPFKSSRRSFDQPRSGYRYQAAPPQASVRLSVEPINIHKGDRVIVTADTSLRRGEEVLAAVPAGQAYTVIQVVGPWVGIALDQQGTEVRGWVNFRSLKVQ